jgi:uncharacterized membrane protein
MSTPDPTQSPRPRRLWLRILFGVSLALNLLVVGVLAGAWWRFDGGRSHAGPSSIGALVYRELPKAERKELRKQFMKGRDGPRGSRRADMAALLQALRAEPFDGEAVEALLVREQTRRAEHTVAMRDAWLAHVTEMTPEERTAYADRMEDRMRRHKKGQRKDH